MIRGYDNKKGKNMNLIGIYVIDAPVYREKYITLDQNYDVKVIYNFESKKIDISIYHMQEIVKNFEHIKNRLMIKVIHGINGVGKTTLLKMLSFNLEYRYLIFYSDGDNYYIEGNILHNYEFTVNNAYFNTSPGLMKRYLSLYLEDGKLSFYNINIDGNSERNVRCFTNLNRDSKSIRDVGNGYYYASRLDEISDLEKMMYFFTHEKSLRLHLTRLKNFSVKVSFKANISDPKELNEEDSRIVNKTNDIFNKYGFVLSDLKNPINAFRYKIVSDAIGISLGIDEDWISSHEIYDINDFTFLALEKSFELGNGFQVYKEQYDIIIKFLEDINMNEVRVENDLYHIFVKNNSNLIVGFLSLYEKYCKEVEKAHESYHSKMRNKTWNQVNHPNPYLSSIFSEYFDVNFGGKSSGEEAYINLLIMIFKAIEDDYSYSQKNDGITYIILDEIDTNLHPELNRQLINNFVDIFSRVNSRYCLIVSTHSEYVLSDVPISNVILLGEQHSVSLRETFAKHIGDIALDNMIVKNAIGEYAINKVKEIIEFQTPKEDYDDLVNIIGDPFIKKMLQKLTYLDEKDDKQ